MAPSRDENQERIRRMAAEGLIDPAQAEMLRASLAGPARGPDGGPDGGSGGEDKLIENVIINFREFKVDYQEQGPDGKAKGGAVSMAYNVAVGEATG